VPATLPYGSWPSPITSDLLVEQVVRLSDPVVHDDELWWNEGRPAEGGRQVLVASVAGGRPEDRIPEGFSARTAVHEYGGSCYAVLPDSSVVFSNWADQRLWLAGPGTAPVPLTPEPATPRSVRWADPTVVAGGAWLVAVRERHEADGVINDVVAVVLPPPGGAAPGGTRPVDPGTTSVNVLAGGQDFYGSPRPSPDGTRIAWVAWDHPSMPWDSTTLWVADLVDGVVAGEPRRVAGGPGVSVSQPRWSPDGRLHHLSDRTGWWNLYDDAGTPLAPLDTEFGGPDWIFGQSTYTFLPDGRIVAEWSTPGGGRLGLVEDGTVRPLDLAYGSFVSLRAAGATSVVAIVGSPIADPAVVRIDVEAGTTEVMRRSRETSVDAEWLSVPEPIEYPTAGGLTAHALWYHPTNPEAVGPDGDLPPLVVMSHGGPTSAASSVLAYGVQYWTSRGIGVVDVDYGGSTGYGRAYRERLKDRWGIVDVDDCVAAALWLADRGLVDRDRMAIRGGSAGGYTTLAALTFRDVFAVGASHYGVADLELLARDTHKFESRYLDGLVGPYPEAIATYHERSPIHHVGGLDRPLILFQGLEDAVVPPAQAEVIATALAARGVPVAHLTFEGEQHGFRQAATIRRVIDTELDFYGKVLGFVPADSVEPYEIVNAEALPAGGRT
jgi:dipeptidyl aminopeptidase/acylaminoacyl peptidase